MLLNFIKVDFRTKVLVEKYTELISAGVKPSEILVLVQNSTLKKQFVDKILENIKIDAIEKLNVHSFFQLYIIHSLKTGVLLKMLYLRINILSFQTLSGLRFHNFYLKIF